MASQHYRVSPKFWVNERRAWTDAERLLGLYLLTCEHRNTEGLYRLPKGYICEDLGWTPRKASETLAALVSEGFVAYDEDAQVVFLPKALLQQRPTTRKQVQGALNELGRLPRTVLWRDFMAACDQHAPRLATALRDGVASAFADTDENAQPDARTDGDTDTHANTHTDAVPLTRAHPTRRHISSSTPTPSLSPPRPPVGNRERDQQRFEDQLTVYVAEHLPGVDAVTGRRAVKQAIEKGGATSDGEVFDWLRHHWPQLLPEGAAA